MESYKLGDPKDSETDIGPMARKDLRDNLHQQVKDSVAAGAKIELGGEIPDEEGFFYPATILSQVNSDTRAFSEEFFGPVAIVIKYQDINEAIEIANSVDFGLGGGIFSQDEDRAYQLAVNEIDSGACFINDFVKSHPKLPFGGVKKSGYGRELSREGLKLFLNIKTICLD